jgi:predicted MFS family arabinose efflux permease
MTLIDVMVYPYLLAVYLPNWSWLFMLFVFTPIMSFFVIYVNVWVSYRARDTKSAQQIGGSVIVVVLGVMVSSFLGMMDVVLYTLTAVFAAMDVILTYFAPKVFSREAMIAKF